VAKSDGELRTMLTEEIAGELEALQAKLARG
jgi:ribosomal protein L29